MCLCANWFDCCIEHSNGALAGWSRSGWCMVVVAVVVACCFSIPLQLALVLVLTFAPCAAVVFLQSTGANTPLAHVVVVTHCNLHCMVVFFLPATYWHKYILHLHSCNFGTVWWCMVAWIRVVVLVVHKWRW